MTPEQKQDVIKWLGEEWLIPYGYIGVLADSNKPMNRTFTEWSDFGRCFERLVETGQRLKFMDFMRFLHQGRSIVVDETTWLLSRTEDGTFRLCNLIARAIKEGIVK